MGVFDGILLCSDWDGTLCSGTTISERDIEAIKYFQENGGLFTISSGRHLPYLKSYFGKVKPNTYVICLNGAIIIDPESGEKIYEGKLDADANVLIDKIVEIGGFYSMALFPFGVEDSIRYTIDEYKELRKTGIKQIYYKAILESRSTESIDKAKVSLSQYSDRYSIVSSWSESIEILSIDCTKGEAVRRLKELTGARIAVAIGDYENDVSMLQCADISFAPSNAISAAREAADKVTLSSCGGAIAEVISILEASL